MTPNIIKIDKFRLRKKIAIFDYDWTLVRPKSNGTFSKSLDDWMWLNKTVPIILHKIYNDGFSIVVISNQTRNTEMKTNQIINVMSSIELPSLIMVASEEIDKKPNTTMFNMLKEMTKKDFDMKNSFFVGDALGRQDDWSNTDKLFAQNIGILKIFAPDDIFPVNNDEHIKKFKELNTQEIIVIVGYPGSGKTKVSESFSSKYKALHGDELVTSKKILKEAEKYLNEGFSIIIDATNPSIKKRKEYIDLASKYNIPIRCILMTTDMIESMFRNNKRNKIIPKITYFVFRKNYEEPTINEGFSEVIKI